MTAKFSHFKLALTHQNKIIAQFSSQLRRQQLLLDRIRQALPEPLRPHALYCVSARNKLLIYTPNAAWGTQLRFHTSGILSAVLAWQQNQHIETIQIRIIKSAASITPSQRKPKIPSAEMIEHIHKARATEQDNLSNALINLSKAMHKHNN